MVNLLLQRLPHKPHGTAHFRCLTTPILPSPRPKSMAEEPSRRALRQEEEVEEEEEEDDDDDEEEEEEEEVEAAVAPTTTSGANIYPESWLQLGLGPSRPPPPPPPPLSPSLAGSRPAALQLFAEMPLRLGQSGSARIAAPEGGFLRLMPPPAGLLESADPNRIAGGSSSSGAWPTTPSPTVDAARPDIRVVIPPPRPQAGVWVLLQAAENQGREPSLPQIPRSYIRIKDGRMPVRLLIKYIVEKLGLEDESQVLIVAQLYRAFHNFERASTQFGLPL